MTIEQQVKLLETIVSLAPSLCWPILALLIFVYLGAPLKKFLDSVSEVSLSAAGVEATARKKRQAEATTMLLSEVEDIIQDTLTSDATINKLREIGLLTPDKKSIEKVDHVLTQVADKTVESIRQSNFVTVDSRPLVGVNGEVWQLPYKQFMTVSDFLDNLWYLLQPYGVPSMRYGTLWALRDTSSGTEFKNMGRSWAKGFDTRSLADVGILPGMTFEAIPLSRRRS